MKFLKSKNLLLIFLTLVLSFFTISNLINNYTNVRNYEQLKTASFSGAYVGLTWTLRNYDTTSDDELHMSYKIKAVNSSQVTADVYMDGLLMGRNMAIGYTGYVFGYVLSDSVVGDCISSYGTYNEVYGGKNLNVTCNQTMGMVIDTETGVMLEYSEGTQGMILYKWSLYGTSSAIPGFAWVLILSSVIFSTVYLIKIRYKHLIKCFLYRKKS